MSVCVCVYGCDWAKVVLKISVMLDGIKALNGLEQEGTLRVDAAQVRKG